MVSQLSKEATKLIYILYISRVKFINLYGPKLLLLRMQMSWLGCSARFNYGESLGSLFK